MASTPGGMPTKLGSRSLAALVDEFAVVLGWPTSRAGRLLSGNVSDRVGSARLCATERSLAEPAGEGTALLLAAPFLHRRGRRSYDAILVQRTGDDGTQQVGEFSLDDWERGEQVVYDASAMLCGGADGFEDQLADALGGRDATPIVPVDRDDVKFAGYVPKDSLEDVRAAVFAAGAGQIGDYSECSWSTEGTGTFRGGEDSDPTVGEPGKFEQAPEVRFETICPSRLRHAVARAYVRAHPYEEPAYEVFSLLTPASVGTGRLITIDEVGDVSYLVRQLLAEVADIREFQPGNGAGTAVAVTVGELAGVLPEVLREPDVALVVCAGASRVERELLEERGIALALIDREAVLRKFGPALAARLSRSLGLAVEFSLGLEFPGVVAAAPAATSLTATTTAAHAANGGAPAQLWFDGGSRGNPGPGAAGYVIYDGDGNEIMREGVALGEVTNNVAEYNGLVRGLERALEMGARKLDIYSDSELVVRQIEGRYKVKHASMKPLFAQAKEYLGQLERHKIRHVLRADNSVADALVNETLDREG